MVCTPRRLVDQLYRWAAFSVGRPLTPPIPPLYPPLYLGSKGPRVQGPPNGSKGILWEGPRAPPGFPWGSYGIQPRDPWVPLWDPIVPPRDPWGVLHTPHGSLGRSSYTPGTPGVIFIHPRDPWGDLRSPQWSLGCYIYIYVIYIYI